jgi:hypothetical protein
MPTEFVRANQRADFAAAPLLGANACAPSPGSARHGVVCVCVCVCACVCVTCMQDVAGLIWHVACGQCLHDVEPIDISSQIHILPQPASRDACSEGCTLHVACCVLAASCTSCDRSSGAVPLSCADCCVFVGCTSVGSAVRRNADCSQVVCWLIVVLGCLARSMLSLSRYANFCVCRHAMGARRYGIPHGVESRTAWYPARRGIPHGVVSRTAWYPRARVAFAPTCKYAE